MRGGQNSLLQLSKGKSGWQHPLSRFIWASSQGLFWSLPNISQLSKTVLWHRIWLICHLSSKTIWSWTSRFHSWRGKEQRACWPISSLEIRRAPACKHTPQESHRQPLQVQFRWGGAGGGAPGGLVTQQPVMGVGLSGNQNIKASQLHCLSRLPLSTCKFIASCAVSAQGFQREESL